MEKEELKKVTEEITKKTRRVSLLLKAKNNVISKFNIRIYAIDAEIESLQRLYWKATGKWLNVEK